MGTIEIAAGESTKIADPPYDGDAFTVQVDGSDVYLSHNPQSIQREGERVKKNDRIRIDNLRGRPVYALNPSGAANTAVISVNKASFNINFDSPTRIDTVDATRQNQDGAVGETFTVPNSNTSPQTQDVPDGFAAVIQSDPANNDNIDVIGNVGNVIHVIQPGGTFSLRVQDLDDITLNGTSNNPTVHVGVEAP